MSEDNKGVEFSLKVVVNKQKTKVLFAEIDSDFADVLFSFLTLPLGRIVRILKQHYGEEAPVFGSLSSLYNSVANLDGVHFWTEGAKLILLHPRSSSDEQCMRSNSILVIPRRKNISSVKIRNVVVDSKKVNVYYDGDVDYCYKKNCSSRMTTEVAEKDNTFHVADDLTVTPFCLASIISSFVDMDIPVSDVQIIELQIGLEEGLSILKVSLSSKSALTDALLLNHNISNKRPKTEPALV